jgi:hypothetical protein
VATCLAGVVEPELNALERGLNPWPYLLEPGLADRVQKATDLPVKSLEITVGSSFQCIPFVQLDSFAK